MDHLLLKLQWLDERGDSVLDIASPSTSILVKTQAALQRSLVGAIGTSPFRHILSHFGNDDQQRASLSGRIRDMVLNMGGELWYRSLYLHTYPFTLFQIVHPSYQGEGLSLCNKLFAEHPCCLDDPFSLKLRALFTSGAQMHGNAALLEDLRMLSCRARLTNMHIERLLAKVKAATLTVGGIVNLLI